jgi:hypothetical protein
MNDKCPDCHGDCWVWVIVPADYGYVSAKQTQAIMPFMHTIKDICPLCRGEGTMAAAVYHRLTHDQ